MILFSRARSIKIENDTFSLENKIASLKHKECNVEMVIIVV